MPSASKLDDHDAGTDKAVHEADEAGPTGENTKVSSSVA
jgi:hypothetical protein